MESLSVYQARCPGSRVLSMCGPSSSWAVKLPPPDDDQAKACHPSLCLRSAVIVSFLSLISSVLGFHTNSIEKKHHANASNKKDCLFLKLCAVLRQDFACAYKTSCRAKAHYGRSYKEIFIPTDFYAVTQLMHHILCAELYQTDLHAHLGSEKERNTPLSRFLSCMSVFEMML